MLYTFFYYKPHYTDIKNKKYYNHQVLYSQLLRKKEEDKLKKFEREVKMIIKMRNVVWQIVFMSDTNKETLIDLYEILMLRI